MSLLPNLTERLARARTDLRLGLPVVLEDGNLRMLVLAAESLDETRLSEALTLGAAALVITDHRATTLKTPAYDGSVARLALPDDVTAKWVASVADPADDMGTPLKGPFRSLRDGPADMHKTAVNLIKSARLLPAAVVVTLKTPPPKDLTVLDAGSANNALSAPISHQNVVSGRVPITVSEAGRVHVFRPADGGDEHVVCEIGRPPRDRPVLARLHSACFTGDILGSLKCDCGPQLHAALAQMGQEGAGLLLYLNQEGRGIGLANKMRAYALQDQGFDTVEANHRLGFDDDERDFRTGADLLKRLGFSSVRLLTNNPAKVAMMKAQNIDVVERVPLQVGRTKLNEKYLDVKAKKSGHIL